MNKCYSKIYCKRCKVKLFDFTFNMQFDKNENRYLEQNKAKITLKIEKFENTRVNFNTNKIVCTRCGNTIGKKLVNRINCYEIIRKNIEEEENHPFNTE